MENKLFIDLDKKTEIPKINAFQGQIDIKKNGRMIVKNSVLEDIDTFTNEDLEYILINFKNYISPIMTSSYIPTSSMMEIIKKVAPEFKVRFKTEKVGGDKIVAITAQEFFKGEKIFDSIINKMNPNWTESQKYRYLYIQTGIMLSYDLNVLEHTKNSAFHEKYSRNIFTSISENWGICASFAAIYDYLCYKVGLDSMILSEDDHDYVMITDSEEKNYLTDPTFDSAKLKFGLKTENYAIPMQMFEENSHNLQESYAEEYDFSDMSEEELEDIDRSIGYLDEFGGKYTDDILANLANELEGDNIVEKFKDFLHKVSELKTIGRPTDSDYLEITRLILSKCNDKNFSENIEVSSLPIEDSKELPRRLLFKITEKSEDKSKKQKFYEFDYKTKMYNEVDEKTLDRMQSNFDEQVHYL